MEITTRTEKDITVVAISGSLDGNTAPAAQEKIMPLLTGGCRLVFDMERCGYVSSAGLRLLLVIAKRLEQVNGAGIFAALAPAILDVMKMTGFDNIFSGYQSVDDAVEALAKV